MPEQIDPALYERGDLRRILATLDIAALYQALKHDAGLTQRQIARRTGQSQSEVSEILSGRKVENHKVLRRIVVGLDVPPEMMGLSWYGPDGAHHGPDDAYAGNDPSGGVAEVTDDMLRRDALAKGAIALVGAPVLGKLLTSSAGPGELALPSQVGMADVDEIKNTTEQLRVAARTRGGQARAVSAAAAQYGRLTQVPASEAVTARLFSQLAELNELAGWCCFDSGVDLHARWHYRTAIDLAQHVHDNYRMASALRCMGLVDRWCDHPDEAMKQFDIAQLVLGAKGDPDLMAWLQAVSAMALADMEHPQARTKLAAAQDGWQATDIRERADQSYQAALVHMSLGNLELAEQFVSTVNGAGRVRPVGVFAAVLRSTIHVQAGDPRGLSMAKSAIAGVAPLHSVRARERLVPLAAALEARPGSDHRELAWMARQVATLRQP